MTMRLMVTGLVCVLMLCAGCYNPPVEKFHSRKAMERGDYATAEQKLLAVVENDPSDWEGHYLLGLAYLGQDRPIEAQTELELALAANDRSTTNTPKILNALAEALHQQESYDQLYAFLDAQIDRYEGWEDYARKARFLAKANDMDGASLAYRQAAIFSRNADDDIYVEMAEFYEGLGDYDKAVQCLKWAYYVDEERADLPDRFRKLGVVPGPTLKERPPQPEYDGDTLKLPRLFN